MELTGPASEHLQGLQELILLPSCNARKRSAAQPNLGSVAIELAELAYTIPQARASRDSRVCGERFSAWRVWRSPQDADTLGSELDSGREAWSPRGFWSLGKLEGQPTESC